MHCHCHDERGNPLCEHGECREQADDTCFDCEDAICEEHARLIPNCTLLLVCPSCHAKRLRNWPKNPSCTARLTEVA